MIIGLCDICIYGTITERLKMDSAGLYNMTREQQAELETSLEEIHVKVKLEHAKITSANEIPEDNGLYCDESHENRPDPIEIKPMDELESQMIIFLPPKDMYVTTSMENTVKQEKQCEGLECESVPVAEMRKINQEALEDVVDDMPASGFEGNIGIMDLLHPSQIIHIKPEEQELGDNKNIKSEERDYDKTGIVHNSKSEKEIIIVLERLYYCELCREIFHSVSSFDGHRKKHKMKNQEKCFQCKLCPKAFSTRHLLLFTPDHTKRKDHMSASIVRKHLHKQEIYETTRCYTRENGHSNVKSVRKASLNPHI